MREIVFDTETTGLDPFNGDRIVEIGCVELVDQTLTGRSYHVYINPERDMPEAAYAVHGLSKEFLLDKPKFKEIAPDFLGFIGEDSKLVAHNAKFDMNFINFELKKLGEQTYSFERVIDTLDIAKRKHPMGPNSLDALCARYNIDNSKRQKHGAFLDAELLAEVYVELLGGKQRNLDFVETKKTPPSSKSSSDLEKPKPMERPKPIPLRLQEIDRQAHRHFVNSFKTRSKWTQIWENGQ